MRDEDLFHTVRFQKCKACGQVFTGSLSGENNCPTCLAPLEPQIPAGGRFRCELNGAHALFTLRGSVYKIQELEELRAEISQVLESGVDSLAFSFEESPLLNSSMINLLVKATHSLTLLGKSTFIITDEVSILESLQMMDLDRVMKIVPNLETYRAALG